MKREWVVDIVEKLPQGLVSRAWGWMARRKHPRLGVWALKRVFVKATGIDMQEAAEAVDTYPTLEDLFVRHLKSGARRVDPDPGAFVSPVDGTVGVFGKVQDGTLLQVKGRSYSLQRLLGSEADAERFEGGSYVTIYLAPHNYHRIHAPVSGRVEEAMVIPGSLMPVFTEAVSSVEELFARNERLITYLDTAEAGRVAVVKVGATLVGRISLAYDDTVWTNRAYQRVPRRLRYDPARVIQKGAEVGAFELGSTVVIICEPNTVTLDQVTEGASVRLGQRIGSLTARASRPRRGASRSGKGKKLYVVDPDVDTAEHG